jgi:hypothetical protein
VKRKGALRFKADYQVIDRQDLAGSELEGRLFGGVNVSPVFIDAELGQRPRLHRHPYE